MQRITYGATSIDTTEHLASVVYDLHAVALEQRLAMQVTVPGYLHGTDEETTLITVLLPDTPLTVLTVADREPVAGAERALENLRLQMRELIQESVDVEKRFGLKYSE